MYAEHQPSGPQPDDESTPDPRQRIEAATAGLDGIEDRPIAEHVAVFDAVHAALTDALSDIDKV